MVQDKWNKAKNTKKTESYSAQTMNKWKQNYFWKATLDKNVNSYLPFSKIIHHKMGKSFMIFWKRSCDTRSCCVNTQVQFWGTYDTVF